MENFNRLPFDITLDIFTRLPTELVVECKVVSKTWRDLIQHPLFSQMHFNRLNHYADPGKLSFLALNENDQLHYFEYTENHETHISRRINLTPPFEYFSVVGSFNGLICFSDLEERFCICNPMTKEYVILPKPKKNFRGYRYWLCGFGYLPSTNEYNVVAIHKENLDPGLIHVMLYTLGRGNGWRNVGKFESEVLNVYGRNSVCCNGSLYWRHGKRRIISVFDLSDENFSELQLPPTPTDFLQSSYGSPYKFGVLGEYLFCRQTYYKSYTGQSSDAFWLYKKRNDDDDIKGNVEPYQSWGWTDEFQLPEGQQPLAFTKSGEIVSYSSGCLNIYDPKASTSIISSNGYWQQNCWGYLHMTTEYYWNSLIVDYVARFIQIDPFFPKVQIGQNITDNVDCFLTLALRCMDLPLPKSTYCARTGIHLIEIYNSEI
ncbi:F-box protein DOR-like [Papaver somniferum]|uniref:F-box protein DOR-like n=1 Tax=Papaver somniferum TaxID=3469 RepID=UPI000E701045|nr:F-box protein DOR-like [Papaver somniferum]